ncbi:MAG: hypothetical protein AABY42_01355 [Nitrospirota bacterium]
MNTAVYVVFIFSIVVVSVVTPLILSRQRLKFTWWDYASPFLGIPLWFILRAFNIGGSVSESNFIIEIFLVLIAAITVPWLRFFLTFGKARFFIYASFFLTLVPSAVTLCLRLAMPVLPE